MNIKEWVNIMERSGQVCPEYMRKLAAAGSKEDVFRVLCDVNGGAWLFGLHAKGMPLPVDDFVKEYGSFINGGRIVEYPKGYTSKFYCRPTDVDMDADTTLVYLLECMDMEIYVPKNKYPSIILSDGSQADVVLGDGARVNIEMYGDARVNLVGDQSRVRIKKH